MWLARNAPALTPCLLRECRPLASTARIPTVIWVGRKSESGVDLKIGSRTIGFPPKHHFFWAAALFGLRLWMWPLSVPAVGSMTALISAGLPEASASVTALVRLGVSVQ